MIIEVDEYKTKVEGYNPDSSEDFHAESARLANSDFVAELKTHKYNKVILMAGGTASGKTEFCYTYIKDKKALVYDGTLKKIDNLIVKLQKIKRYAKYIDNVKVILVIPKDINASYAAFLKRDRKMSTAVFFETQILSKLVVADILKNHTEIKVEIKVSVYEPSGKLNYIKVSLKKGRKNMAKVLEDLAHKINDLAKIKGFDVLGD